MISNKHKSILKEFTRFGKSKVTLINDSCNSVVYDIDGKHIAKFSKNSHNLNFAGIILSDDVLKIIKPKVSFDVPVYDLIAYQDGTAFTIHKKIIGDQLNFALMSDAQIKAFLTSFARGLSEMHSINLDKFKNCRLPIFDLTKYLQDNSNWLESRLKPFVNEKHLKLALQFIRKYAKTIKKTNPLTITHGDMNIMNIIINPKTKKLSGLLDFDNVVIAEPCFDFSLLNMKLFKIAYQFYDDKKLLGKNETDAIMRQQVYHMLKLLWHLKEADRMPKEHRNLFLIQWTGFLESALKDLRLLK